MTFLEQYDAASEADKWPLTRQWLDETPLALFAELREKRPILVTPVTTLVSRYVDVIDILHQPKTYTVELYVPSVGEYMLAQDDTPLHTREKAVMTSLLNRNDIAGVRQQIATRASAMLAAAGGHIDLGQDYSRLVPITVVQDYFGLTGGDPRTMVSWSAAKQLDSFRNHPFLELDDREGVRARSDAAGQAIAGFIGQLFTQRGGEIQAGTAKDDIVTRLMLTQYPPAVDFPMLRAAANAGGLLVGTVETTSQAVLQTLRQLFKRPEILARAIELANADATDEFDAIVWEALRWDPVAPFVFRLAAADRTIAMGTDHETFIPKGTVVLALLQSAMFDPALFPHPDEFDSTRPYENYMHFGYGEHECLGKYVGIVLIPEMVRQVLRRPGIKPDAALDFAGSPYPQHYMLSWNG